MNTARMLVVTALVAAGLVAWDRALARDEAAGRADGVRIARLVSEADREAGPVAALRIENGRGESHLFGRRDGVWRCLTWRGAVADEQGITDVVGELLEAEGILLSERPERPQDYGFDGEDTWTVRLHGPKASLLDPGRDVLFAFDVGRAFGEGDGSFVRRHGETGVWSVDTRPARSLGRPPGSTIPPLVDRRLMPAYWPGGSPRIQTIRIEQMDEPPYELHLRAKRVSDEDLVAGKAPFEWVLVRDGLDEPCAEMLVVFYTSWLVETTWQDLADAALLPHVGLDRPRARLTLMSGQADPLVFVQGSRLPSGGQAVWISTTELLADVPPEHVPRLFPRAKDFAPDAVVNPWDV